MLGACGGHVRPPGTRVLDLCEPPNECGESNPRPRQEPSVSPLSSPQPFVVIVLLVQNLSISLSLTLITAD